MKKVPPDSDAKAILELPADWVPLHLAPWYCFRDGLVVPVNPINAWTRAAEAEAGEIVKYTMHPDKMPWAFEPRSAGVEMHCAGIVTFILPGYASIGPDDFDFSTADADTDTWVLPCSPASLLETNVQWDNELMTLCRTEAEREAAKVHVLALRRMSDRCHYYFCEALTSGRIQIMARKNSIFAPFEPVALDQWKFFKLDNHPAKPKENWLGPHKVNSLNLSECAATGPAGERLFAIYVARGAGGSVGELAVDQKCRLWVQQLVRDNPERAPEARAVLIAEGANRFPGLSKKAIENIFLDTFRLNQIRNWFPVGRPPTKSKRKTPFNK
jgi:hypothetical protein